MNTGNNVSDMPEDLARCMAFHGHICPGLVYGYRVAREAIKRMDLHRAADEEIVAVSENDSCAVDALQILLGTTIGKGSLILRDFGKNAYTIVHRTGRRAYRFVRKERYEYRGNDRDVFERLESAFSAGTASTEDRKHLKLLKVKDLLARPFDEIFVTEEVPFVDPPYAPLERSEPCSHCSEMTMATKMVRLSDGRRVCIPCAQASGG